MVDIDNDDANEAHQDSTDTFADIPFDFRHHQFKKKLIFPDGWRMTPERREYLERSRQERQLIDQDRINQGKLINGAEEIAKRQKSLAALEFRSKVPAVEAQRGGKRNTKVKEKVRIGR